MRVVRRTMIDVAKRYIYIRVSKNIDIGYNR